jgi:uncharacterized protein with von Willebrand factor type A (vWA) domain
VFIDQLVLLAEGLRAEGVEVGTSELIDAAAALAELDLADAAMVRAGLRATLIKRPGAVGAFDRCFDAVFRLASAGAPRPLEVTDPGDAHDAVLEAVLAGDATTLADLAAHAIALFGHADDGESQTRVLNRAQRALDLSRLITEAMRRLRIDGSLTELELMLRRNEIVRLLDEFRRMLAAEADLRVGREAGPSNRRIRPDERDLLHLSRRDYDELRRMMRPLVRQLAARIGTRRQRRRTSGRVDVRRTIRRSLEAGGVPFDVAQRRRHPSRPDIVVLCDVSGSVAEFAQFTFTMLNALHDLVPRVRSFAFVDGVAEVTDVFTAARYEVPVRRLVERRGVVGLAGHSDYGKVFDEFAERHLVDAVTPATTVIVTGDARGNFHDGAPAAFSLIAARARRVHWLNPEPASEWGRSDSLIDIYRPHCTAVHEVRTLRQLADVIVDLV